MANGRINESDWKLLKVYYGGLEIQRKSKVENSAKVNEDSIGASKDHPELVEIQRKSNAEKSAKAKEDLIRILKNHSEISFIVDISSESEAMYHGMTVFEEESDPPYLFMIPTPLCFRLHLSEEFQHHAREDRELGLVLETVIEDFIVLIDGNIMIVACECVSGKSEYGGFSDVKEKIIRIINDELKAIPIPPYLCHTPLYVKNDKSSNPVDNKELYTISINGSNDRIEVLNSLYYAYFDLTHYFYEASSRRLYTNELASKIYADRSRLYQLSGDIISINSWHFVRRLNTVTNIRNLVLEALKDIEEYSLMLESSQSDLEYISKELEKPRYKNLPLNDEVWKDYIIPDKVEMNSLTKLLEFVREDVKLFYLTTSAILAALLGGIIGGFLTHFL